MLTRAEWDKLTPRERDAAYAKATGWKRVRVLGGEPDEYVGEPPDHPGEDNWIVPRFTTSWDAMRECVERLRGEFGCIELVVGEDEPDDPNSASCWIGVGEGVAKAYAPTLPEAVCVAALVALGHMETGRG